MASRHVLVLGGHGKVAQHLTPLLLKRSWTVTSLIRAQDQVPAIEKLGAGLPGKLNVLVSSIEDLTNQDKAATVLNQVKPDYIAWSAGAGGKGGAERTFKIDRDAAINVINAAATIPSITRFLLVSYPGSRRNQPPWWPANEWEEYYQKVNIQALPNYYKAKVEADEVLYKVGKSSKTLIGIDLRPGTLSEEPAGPVALGKIESGLGSKISREGVAQVADALLASDGIKTSWLDLLDGDESVESAVQRVIRDGVDTAEGEDFYQP